jgi:hypothetical protein
MTENSKEQIRYEAVNWQNHGRRLKIEEFSEIRGRIAGLHFTKETFADDEIAMQALYAAEALQREVELLIRENPFPNEETTEAEVS